MAKLLAATAVAFTLFTAAPAGAASILFLHCDECVGPPTGLAFEVFDQTVQVIFRMENLYGPNALGFNILGSTAGLRIFDLPEGFSVGGTNGTIGPFGTFEFLISGPAIAPMSPPPFTQLFRITRDAGFASTMSVFERNAAGFYMGASVMFSDGVDTIAASTGSGLAPDVAPVPEPASMLLLGSGLAAVWRARRRSSS